MYIVHTVLESCSVFPHIKKQPRINVLMYKGSAWTSLNGDLETSRRWLKRKEQQNSCSILTVVPWGPSGPGKPVSPSGPLSPCQRKETADVSVGSDKGMTHGLTAQRELEAAAHWLSWDPWLSTSPGLPLSITNIGREQTLFDRSSTVSFYSTFAASHL